MVNWCQRDDSVVVVVDMQTRLLPVIQGQEQICRNLKRLVQGARILGIPILVTQQYTRGLGETVPDLLTVLEGIERIEKTTFSCFGEAQFVERLKELGRNRLIVGGIETHVCITQTVLHGLHEGYRVHVLSDGVGSRLEEASQQALVRLVQAGAIPTASESVLFEWLERAGTPEFKEIQGLIKAG